MALAVGGLGLYALGNSSAATYAANREAEAGQITGNAAPRSGAEAPGTSAGQAVVFGVTPGGQPVSYGASGNGVAQTADCSLTLAAGQSLQSAVNAAASGAVICVPASDRSSESVNVDKALTVRATGTVRLKNAVLGGAGARLEGFRVVGPASVGIAYSGTNHRISHNLVSGRGITTGIQCNSCGSGHVVANNTVTAITNYGLWLGGGDNITVERNNVYDLWKTTSGGDVDAMRMWGTNHKIRHNYFHDINEFKSAANGGGNPHTDCWQSYQTGSGLQARHILIENNYCVRVSRQCMILSNHLTGSYDIRDITFRGNVCETYDSSVINLGSVAGIIMENNFFLGGVRVQVLTVDYIREENPVGLPDRDISLRNNIVMKGISSASYFYRDSTRTLIDNTANLLVFNGVVKTNADSFHASPNVAYSAVKAADFTAYRQLARQYEVVDKGAPPRTAGFGTEIDGGQRLSGAAIDIGPFEHR